VTADIYILWYINERVTKQLDYASLHSSVSNVKVFPVSLEVRSGLQTSSTQESSESKMIIVTDSDKSTEASKSMMEIKEKVTTDF